MGTEKRKRQKEGRQQRIAAAIDAQERAEKRGRLLQVAIGVTVLVAIVGTVFLLTRNDTGDDGELATDTSTTSTSTPSGPVTVTAPPPGQVSSDNPTRCPKSEGQERTTSFAAPPPMCIDPTKTYTATFDTTAGKVVVALDSQRMPGTVNNFVVLSRFGFYDQTMLFRTDPSIDIIQGGAPTTNSPGDPGPGYTIPDEGGPFDWSGEGRGPFTYDEGQLIMARTPQPNGSAAQFFFSSGPNVKNLDSQGTYLLFGNVTEGLDVLQAIMASHVPCAPRTEMTCLGGGPKDPVVVNTVTITES